MVQGSGLKVQVREALPARARHRQQSVAPFGFDLRFRVED